MLQVFKNKIFFKNKNFFLPTYPNFFGQVTGNRNIFFFGLTKIPTYKVGKVIEGKQCLTPVDPG